MISFYPGPSKVHDKIPSYVKDAAKSGILGMNHRSKEFIDLYANTRKILQEKLEIPDDYEVLFTSSATECWEIIGQSLHTGISYHFFNGAFGKKWFDYTNKLGKPAIAYQFDPNTVLKLKELDISAQDGLICLTHNETSNGTSLSGKCIAKIRKPYPDHIIAVDATSSMGGMKIKFSEADVWYASVQKCFGLPAGMGIMIISPRAIKRVYEIGERNHYNSLCILLDHAKNNQTSYTPNVLNIYLLNQVLHSAKPIDKIDNQLRSRMKRYYKFFKDYSRVQPHVENSKVRSSTVLCLEGDAAEITNMKKEAEKNGLLLGNGYGDLKENTFRIANFPAHRNKEIKALKQFFTHYFE